MKINDTMLSKTLSKFMLWFVMSVLDFLKKTYSKQLDYIV